MLGTLALAVALFVTMTWPVELVSIRIGDIPERNAMLAVRDDAVFAVEVAVVDFDDDARAVVPVLSVRADAPRVGNVGLTVPVA